MSQETCPTQSSQGRGFLALGHDHDEDGAMAEWLAAGTRAMPMDDLALLFDGVESLTRRRTK